MANRRQFSLYATAALDGLPALRACSSGTAADSYEQTARNTWRPGKVDIADSALLQREWVRCATLAPSSHNTHCRKFRFGQGAIDIQPDLSRRCPVVDPDDHPLFVSLGCAAENLVQAALAHGLKADATFDGASSAVAVRLEPTPAVVSPLFQAIPERQCTRAEYDGKALSKEELALLRQAGTGRGVQLMLLSERTAMEKALEYIVQGNTAQLNDPAFVEELRTWIRFTGSDAVGSGDGLYGASSGNASVPEWLGRLVFGMLVTPTRENEKCAKQLRSSAGVAVFVSDVASPAHWVEVGCCYERFTLQAAAMGMRNAFSESSRRSRCAAAAVRKRPGHRHARARSGDALWSRAEDAAVVAAAGAGRSRLRPSGSRAVAVNPTVDSRAPGVPMGGEPRPILFDGRFVVRGERIELP